MGSMGHMGSIMYIVLDNMGSMGGMGSISKHKQQHVHMYIMFGSMVSMVSIMYIMLGNKGSMGNTVSMNYIDTSFILALSSLLETAGKLKSWKKMIFLAESHDELLELQKAFNRHSEFCWTQKLQRLTFQSTGSETSPML
jgi:hypothetical protein